LVTRNYFKESKFERKSMSLPRQGNAWNAWEKYKRRPKKSKRKPTGNIWMTGVEFVLRLKVQQRD
jgi:hypothetical protein